MYGHKYTPEERTFFQSFVPGHSHKEIQEEFTARFGWEISRSQVSGYIKNHHLNTGRTGRFEKGQVSHNKGKKGLRAPGCEKGWFSKGHTPKNHKPVGSERLSKDGYWEIKIAEPNKWRLKHLAIWEQHNGSIPKGSCIIFLDGNTSNLDIKNLMMIRRRDLVRMNQSKLFSDIPEVTEAGAHVAELLSAMGEAKRKRKNC